MTASYRLQLTKDFPIGAVREHVPYLHELGVSHLYLSPVLAARPGSTHGYDLVDHARLNPDLGTEDDLRGLAGDLHTRGMGIILDLVPNHMATGADNKYWDDVLERGRSSRFAAWFDIDWDAPHANRKVVLPVLKDDLALALDRGEIGLRIRDSGSRISYFDHTFPLDGATLPKEVQLAQLDPAGRPAAEAWAAGADGRQRMTKLLDAQHYRLSHWRRGFAEINYRRFFDVNDLVALRMDNDEIFDVMHARILEWVRDGVLDGLRVDHVDGLRSPFWYLVKLRAAVDANRHPDAPVPFPIFVEKILSQDEMLPSEWPVDGTTGYDFLNDVEDLFLDPRGYEAIEANYRGLRHSPALAFRAVAQDGKRKVLAGSLEADVMRVARLAHGWCAGAHPVDEIGRAAAELIVGLDVYRTYVDEPGVLRENDRRTLGDAFAAAKSAPDVSGDALAMLERAFFAAPAAADTVRQELVARLQQASGPAAAKGVEDTALYAYVPLAARNEVGGAPDRQLDRAGKRLHDRNLARSRDWPRTMNATNTHDTKRSADMRARLDALTEIPEEWGRHVARWRRLNKPLKGIARGKPAPDTNSEYLYYQSLLGLWPPPREARRVDDLPGREWLAQAADRLSAYMLKAARESKTRTSWTESDDHYELALDAFVRGTLAPKDEEHLLPDVARLTARVAEPGFARSLARVVLQLTAPGIPDLYQGDERWSFTLVDPDNRRAVDFGSAAALLHERGATPELIRDAFGGSLADDRVKQAVVHRVLMFRREFPSLMSEGDYLPLDVAAGLFAFARRTSSDASITVARTRTASSERGEAPVARIQLPHELAGRWMSVLTGREIELIDAGGGIEVWPDELLPVQHPCDLLHRTRR